MNPNELISIVNEDMEKRILVTALINVLVECARSDRMHQPVIGTHFIAKTIERALFENEERMESN